MTSDTSKAVKGAPSKEGLSDSLSDPSALSAQYRRRKNPYDYEKIHQADVPARETEGWIVDRPVQSGVWIKRKKIRDRLLEDRVWCLFYRMGYPVLSGTSFKIDYKRQNKTINSKQVDVFAKDDETSIVAECKARDIMGRRNLTQHLHEMHNLMGPFANSIRAHFGSNYNPKILWLFVTENIIWNEKDLERAEASNIRVITENELTYFETFIAHMGSAGRYQFLSEFFRGQEIPGLSNVKVPAVQGSFGPGLKYYSFVVPVRHLLKIAFVNHQALNHPEGRPAYQRMISKSRIKKIGDFIKLGGFFPTNLLVTFLRPVVSKCCHPRTIQTRIRSLVFYICQQNTDPHGSLMDSTDYMDFLTWRTNI